MGRKKIQGIFLAFLSLGLCPAVFAAEVNWKSTFTFYGDNTEFFEPFRPGETILGQQGKSLLEASIGPRGFLRAGIFADFRCATDPQVSVKPILSFEYRMGVSRFILGTLETKNRHGFLEPLAVTTLEFTRPVEYGFQWLQEEETFKSDIFLNWHQLNTPTQPETLDYGFVMKKALDERLWLEAQLHGYHEGGQLYSVAMRNNWAPALGFRWKAPAGFLGEVKAAAFGVLSGDLGGPVVSDTKWATAGYLRLGIQPHGLPELFVLGWKARDFYFKEGDFNYSSYDATQTFYRADRTYVEVGLAGDLPLGGGVVFNSEMRFHWIDEFFAFSSRHALYVPFDLNLMQETKVESKKGKKP